MGHRIVGAVGPWASAAARFWCVLGCLALLLIAGRAAASTCSDRVASAVGLGRPAAPVVEVVVGNAQPVHGTGFVWDGAGHILTNYHVVASGEPVSVRFAGRQAQPATVMAFSAGDDLALLFTAGPTPAPVHLGDDRRMTLGQPVLAVGNSYGAGLEMVPGTLKGFGRAVVTGPRTLLQGMMELRLPLRPGQSGGPLFDCAGRVVGINTAVVWPHQQDSTEISGFAIPIGRADTVVAGLLSVARLQGPEGHPNLGSGVSGGGSAAWR